MEQEVYIQHSTYLDKGITDTPYKWVEHVQSKTNNTQINVWYIIRLRICQND